MNRVRTKKNLARIAALIHTLPAKQAEVSSLSLGDIKERYQALRSSGRLTPDRLSAVLALAGEAVRRITGIVPYDEQYLCAAALYDGCVAEMKTGEGKTLAAVLAAVARAVHGKVHIATVNDYLAAEAASTFADVYGCLGLSVAVNRREADKRRLYEADIVYTSSQELAWDYLRNELLPEEERLDFPLDSVIIDEIDFVLLDNANSHFSVSGDVTYVPPVELCEAARSLAQAMQGVEREREDEFLDLPVNPDSAHYVAYSHNRAVYLTDLGLKFLGDFLHTEDPVASNFRLYRAVLNALEAELFYLNGRDYIVQDGRVVLINRENGRLLPSSQLGLDLHTAIEVKERVPVSAKPLLSNQISYQMLFVKYGHMAGMSGTAQEAADEFKTLFALETVAIPTHRPNLRIDHPDIVFETQADKHRYLASLVGLYRRQSQPVLVITGSETESDQVLAVLRSEGIAANLLNARTTAEEVELVRQAGRSGAVTVSTNIAGRGTDIVIDEESRAAGGLFVVVLNHYRSKRVDNQARGRAGRQGEPGECLFLVSLEDEIWQYADDVQADRIRKLRADEGRFGRSESRILSVLAQQIQDTVDALSYHRRQTEFYLDRVIEHLHAWVKRWLKEVRTWNLDGWIRYVRNNPDASDILLSKGAEPLAAEALIALAKERHEALGGELAERLLRRLVGLVGDREWLLLKHDLEQLKAYLPLRRIPEERYVEEFLRVSHRMCEPFQSDVVRNVLGYFVTARPEAPKEAASN